MSTNKARARSKYGRLKALALAMACWTIAGAARAQMIVSNSVGVKAGITGIVRHTNDNSIGVQFFVTDPSPTGSNITTLTIQKSLDLNSWTNYSSSIMVTGSLPSTEMGDLITASNQFYRMQLINFH
ncbi:MAG TPA: hypothetical protein VMV72_19060 [Verrucomicrobiae bacterium]|nr:hypothetical protein [Verrucomicrobiae bacterium]